MCLHSVRPFLRENGEPEVVPRICSPSVQTDRGRFFAIRKRLKMSEMK
nr:MAG TPA: hypothetical protein [Caudoviricetes sp.]